MKWPFRKKEREPKMALLPGVTLTDEEQEECQGYISSVMQVDAGQRYLPQGAAEVVTRRLVALCMLGRAERFALMRQYAQACEAASKACCIDAMCAHFFAFGCILERAGRAADARTMFAEGLRRYELEQEADLRKSKILWPDLEDLVAYARSRA